MKRNILFVGEGGQGIQTIAKIISQSADTHGYGSTYIPSFGVEQRGAPSIAYVVIDKDEILYPRFEKADLLVILQERGIKYITEKISKDTIIFFDSSTIDSKLLSKYSQHLVAVPATKMAYDIGNQKIFNIICTAIIARLLELDRVEVWRSIESVLMKKISDKSLIRQNEDAYHSGWQVKIEEGVYTKPSFRPESGAIIKKGFGKTASIIPDKCKGCGICILKCPVAALKQSQILGVLAMPVPEINLEKCVGCQNCSNFCPDNAIKVDISK